MYKITKEFEASYAHRVWNQTLNDGQVCKCRRCHGHNSVIQLELKATTLQNDMVLDYNELGCFKKFVDDYIDHRTILDMNDPILKHFKIEYIIDAPKFGFSKIINMYPIKDEVEQELYDSIILIDCVPTSENFCRLIYDGLKKTIPQISKVSWSETGKTNATYSN